MSPARPSGPLVLALAVSALCLAPAAPAAAFDPRPRTGPLAGRAFVAPELSVPSSQVPLETVLAQLPNRAAWEAFLAERATLGVAPPTVYVDPRGGTATNILMAAPLLPGSGVGNRLTMADLATRLDGVVSAVDAPTVAAAARRFLLDHAALLGIDPAELGPVRATPVSDTLWQVSARQVIQGVTVREARLALTISHGNVVTFGTESWARVRARAVPAVSAESALAAAFAYAGGRTISDVIVQEPRLELVVAAPGADGPAAYTGAPGRGYAHRLVWSLAFARRPEDARWEALVDAGTGRLLSFQDTNEYVNAQVTGTVYPLTNTGQCPTPQTCGSAQAGWPMPFADTGLAAPANVTNSAGIFAFDGIPPTTTLSGPFVDVADTCGALSASSGSGDLDLGGLNGDHDCAVGSGGGPGNTAASRSAFYELNKLAEQARGWLPANTWLRSRLVANVNINLTCNAFWNGSTVNFYRSGGGCGNTGEIAAVFDHEWGHGLDDNDANGVLSNSSEGYADIAAIYRLQSSCVGHGFSVGTTSTGCGLTSDGTGPNRNENQVGGLHCDLDCSGVRDADWDKHADHAPDTALGFVCGQCGTGSGPCGRQVHCAAAPARQAAWDFVARDLLAPPFSLDSQSAFLLANRIFYEGSGNIGAWHSCTCGGSSSGCGATNGYMQWLAADDDNGDLGDGTPHMTALFAAFDRHGIACPAPAPVNSGCADAPSAPALAATPGVYAATLDWTAAPGAGSYWVFRSEGHAGCDFGKARIAQIAGTTFIDTEVAAGRSYAYNVVAVGTPAECHSAASNCAQVTPTATTDPEFSVACAPAALTVVQGGQATTTCTVASANGFSAEVTLACAGLPAGLSCAFAPPAVTPAPNGTVTSTLTIVAGPAAANGPATVQVTATDGVLTRAATLSLSVVAPTFNLSCVPSGLSVVQGSSITSTCTVASQNGFAAAVDLSCAALPAGAGCAFDPPSVTPTAGGTASATLTVSTSTTTPAATTSIQAVGSSGALVRSAPLTLTVLAPNFTLSCVPSGLSVVQGGSTTATCTVASQNGFAAPVDLSCANLPAGATCAFSATPVTPPPGGIITSVVTISTAPGTPGGARAFQVNGAGGGLARSAALSINVLVPSFAVACTPTTVTAQQGGAGTSTCRVTSVNTFSAPVALSCAALTPTASCAFSPAEVTPPPNGAASSTLTVSTTPATPLGASAFQAVGNGGGLTRSAALTLSVTAPPDFVVTCTPSALSASPGGGASSICRVTSLRGFSAPVGLACAGQPEGVACAFTPPAVTPTANGSVVSGLAVTAAASTPTGVYAFTATGTSGTLSRSASLSLTLSTTVFSDDFESERGWVANAGGTDTATRGVWERAVPVQYTAGGIIIQNGTTPSGSNDLVTQASTTGSNGDIDGGVTTIQSPPIALPPGVVTLTFSYYLAHRNDSSADDYFRARVVTAAGTTVVFEELGTSVNDSASFVTRSVDLSAYAGQTIRLEFAAADLATDQLLEAAVDDVKIVVR